MVFNDDAILISLLERYDNEEDIKDAVVKYCNGGVLEVGRPQQIEAVKSDSQADIADVLFSPLIF